MSSLPFIGLRAKALGLFFAVGVVMPVVAGAWLLPRYEQAIRSAEERHQQVVLSRVRQHLGGAAQAVTRDLSLVAAAVGQAAQSQDMSQAEQLIRAALASSGSIDVVRFVVPAAGVSTVIQKDGVDGSSVPPIPPDLLQMADRAETAYELVGADKALVVFKVPSDKGQAGYVAAVHLVGQLRHSLKDLLERDGMAEASVLVRSSGGKIIAGVDRSSEDLAGRDASEFPAFRQQSPLIDTTRELEVEGQSVIATQGSITDFGWSVVVWRPLELALSEYYRVKKWGAFVVAFLMLSVILLAIWASGTLSRPILSIAKEAAKIGQRKFDEVKPSLVRSDELGDLSLAMVTMASDLKRGEDDLRAEEKRRSDLERFLSRPLVDEILAGNNDLVLGGKHHEVSVLFADMVAFSRAAEAHSPESVVALLNELFSVMTEVVFRHGGTVDKFIGDCIMAVWGAPIDQEDHANRAVCAARDMMRFLEAAAEEWYQEHGIEVRLAIGINSGVAIVGNVGSEKRMEYTVVGDVVNVAARLESIAAPNQVLMSDQTRLRLGTQFATRLLGQHELSGRKEAVGVYELELV